MAELLLHVTLFDLGRRGKACAQRMAGEQQFAFAFREIGADAGARSLFDETCDMLVGKALDVDGLVVLENAPEEGALRDATEADPALERDDRAGVVAGTAARTSTSRQPVFPAA